jgi:hypothetical protein
MFVRWGMRFGLPALLLLCGGGLAAHAATEAEIEQARLKGLEFIKGQQNTDGSWEYASYKTGITALCTLALIENGIPTSDPIVDKGYRYVKKQVGDVKNTYEVALSILLLARVGDRQDKTTIRTLGARLLAGQNRAGGWGYSCPTVEANALSDVKKLDRQDGFGDNSCTQFGVLGLWVASRYNVPIEDAMAEVASRFLEGQNADGGWGYQPPTADKAEAGNTATRNTMSCAGLFSLTVARATRIRQQQKDRTSTGGEQRGEKSTLLADPVYSKGFTKVGEFAKGINNGSGKYFLWSVERIGVLLGLEKLGEADWFAQGSEALVKTQRPDGSWSEGKEALSDAAFSILFLRKANLGSDISRLLEGAPNQQFAIVNQPNSPRFDTLPEALKAAQAGDTIRIDGNGPFKLSHDVLDKDLTLQAGFGMDPVFEFQIGNDAKGLRYKPERDAEGRHMLKISGGNVTLEGLRLQMDPPITTNPVPWKAIAVTGGSLRMLNCTISESNKRGMTGVVLEGAGQAFFRNCFFVGGKAAVEVVASGSRQEVTFENCLMYSTACVAASNNAEKTPGDIALHWYASNIQGAEAVGCTGYKGQLEVSAVQCLFVCDALSLGFLPTGTTKDGRNWSGRNNVYNLGAWFGANGKKVTTVNDLKSHAKFWDNADKDPLNKTIGWMVSRRVGQFSHALNPQDWDLGDRSELALSSIKYGIAANTIGSGEGYSRYREDIRYNEWKKGVSRAALAAAAP